MKKAEILVIDDESQIRKLLQIILESNDYKFLGAENAKEGIVLAANHSPDLVLLDLGLPDKSGHQVLREVRDWYHKPVIILSVQKEENNIIDALDNGATDYLIKPFRTGELLARIRAAIRRNQNPESDAVILTGDLEIDLVARVVKKNREIVKLTSMEYSLLALLARYEGKVLTHQFILREVWGNNFNSQTQYLRVFVASLRKKIELNPNTPQHIITQSGVGYRFQ